MVYQKSFCEKVLSFSVPICQATLGPDFVWSLTVKRNNMKVFNGIILLVKMSDDLMRKVNSRNTRTKSVSISVKVYVISVRSQ